MKHNLSTLQEIIEDLIKGIEQVKEIWTGISGINPSLEQVDDEHWQIKEANIWIHGSNDTWEGAELERWLFFPVPESKTQNSLAIIHYSEWGHHILEDGVYADFFEEDLPKPEGNESLGNFINRLAQIVEESGWGTKKRRRAINCFLAYLRDTFDQEEVAFIEHVFPEKKDLYFGRIIRKVRPQVRAIPLVDAANIIKQLAMQCAHGENYAKHHAGEALALLWMCLAASRIRLARALESVHTIQSNALILSEPYPELLVPSKFGSQKIRISQRVAKFLKAIADIQSPFPRNTILQTDLPDLRKSLRAAIKKANVTKEIGEVTFLTFLSYPHYFGKNIR